MYLFFIFMCVFFFIVYYYYASAFAVPNITSSTRCMKSGCKGKPILTKSSASMLGSSNKSSRNTMSRPVCRASQAISWPSSCNRSRRKWPAWNFEKRLKLFSLHTMLSYLFV